MIRYFFLSFLLKLKYSFWKWISYPLTLFPWVFCQLISPGGWSSRLPPCRMAYKFFLPQKFSFRGLRVSIAVFGSDGREFDSRWHQQFFLWKRNGVTKIRTHDPQIQSQLCLPLDQEFVKNACKIKKFLDEHLKN